MLAVHVELTLAVLHSGYSTGHARCLHAWEEPILPALSCQAHGGGEAQRAARDGGGPDVRERAGEVCGAGRRHAAQAGQHPRGARRPQGARTLPLSLRLLPGLGGVPRTSVQGQGAQPATGPHAITPVVSGGDDKPGLRAHQLFAMGAARGGGDSCCPTTHRTHGKQELFCLEWSGEQHETDLLRERRR